MMEWYRGKDVLVAGGTGFLGRNLVRRLLELGAQVTATGVSAGATPASDRTTGSGELVIRQADVRSAEAMQQVVRRKAVVFNLAGRSGAVRSMEDPWTDLEVNCRGMLVLLEAVRSVSPDAKVVFPGTRLEFGKPQYLPVDERHPLDPLCLHGVHKLAAEKYHLLYHRIYGLRTTVFRVANPYGPGQPRERVDYGIINRFIHLALAGEPIPVFGEGSQVRDYIFADDVVEAFLRAGMAERSDGRVYNIGSGEGVKMIDVAHLIVRAVGHGRVVHVPWPPLAARIETGDFVADISAAVADLAWQPRVRLEEGIARTVGALRG